jgi:hypothetical protein
MVLESVPVSLNTWTAMTPDRKKPGVAFWATVVVVVVLVAYPLSLFPIAWLENRGIVPVQNSTVGVILWWYCAPARWLMAYGPDWIRYSFLRVFGD